jgi:hypothetical protein
MMKRTDLVSSPVVQDRLLEVFDAFMATAPADQSPGGGGGGEHASSPVYFGARRGLAGAIMDNQRIREGLAPALMHLYSACHAVAGLDVDEVPAFERGSYACA